MVHLKVYSFWGSLYNSTVIEKLRFLKFVCFLFGNYPASGVYMPTFRNTLSVPSS